jgi:two-component system, NtrC family, sensor kinase
VRTLIADDDPVIRRLMEATAAACGHAVVTAADGEAAWAAYESSQPDLVLLDWHMPGPTGVDLCRRIRAEARGDRPYLVLVTARDETDDLRLALEAGADDYVTKPLVRGHLEARLLIAARQHALREARRRADEALAEARYLAGVGETALAVRHEINNPLAAIVSHAQLLQSVPATKAEVQESLQTILDQARRAAAVVRRLGALHEPRSAEYLKGQRMIDLGGGHEAG